MQFIIYPAGGNIAFKIKARRNTLAGDVILYDYLKYVIIPIIIQKIEIIIINNIMEFRTILFYLCRGSAKYHFRNKCALHDPNNALKQFVSFTLT